MAAPANNAFGAPPVQAAHNSFRAPVVNNPFGAPSAQTSVLAPSSASSRQPSPASTQHPPAGPSAKAQLKSQLDAAKKGPRSGRSPSPSTSKAPPTGPSSQQLSVGATKANTMTRRNNKLTGGKPQAASNAGRFGGREGQTPESQRANPFGSAKPSAGQEKVAPTAPNTRLPPGGRRKQPGRLERPQPPRSSSRQGRPKAPLIGEPSERTKQLSPFAFDYANKLYDHLRKENIAPPEWPAEPGNPNNRAAVESFNADFKKYRDKVTASLRKADLIDDPEKRRKLKDALPFKGICEEMCPEFEQIKRIIEDTVSTEEKAVGPDGLTLWPDRSRMVKRYGRSSAGSDAPLPMDVRSVDALRRTTDYLFNDLLQSESNLPSMHSFLWDRTRAVRKDFTFHSQKSAEEMKDMVYCFEAIARFHATALHLLSKKGFANESFVQKQEFEQLGNTVLSLMEAYDACRDKHVQCENEAEFRAYYLLVNAEDPSIANRIPAWGKEFWFESEEVQTAVALVQAMEDVRKPKGPIKPHRPTSLADTSFTNYFSIVEDPRVSYTMACIAEVHFTQVRQAILKNLVRAYARSRDAPRTITASDLNAILRFDTPEEAVEFAELHGLEFSTWVPEGKPPVTEPYLLLNDKRKYVPPPQVGQSFSGTLVERKRSTQSLPYVIYNTIFEEPAEKSPSSAEDSPGLFVTRTAAAPDNSPLGTPSPPLQPAEPSTATAPSTSPFGTVFQTTQAPKTTPSAAAPTGTTTPTFAGFQTSQPSASTQAGKSAFSFLNIPQASSTAGSSPKIPSLLGQPTASSLAASNPAQAPGLFDFLKGFKSTPAPSATTTTPTTGPAPGPMPSAAALPNGAASKPTVASTLLGNASSSQVKPTGPISSSSLLGTSPSSGTAPFSTTQLPKPAEQQPAPAAPAIPSIFVSPPSATSSSTNQGLQPAFFPASTQPRESTNLSSSAPAVPALATPAAALPIAQPAPKRDPFGDFTKWFVNADDGLLEHFTEETLRNLLWDVWQGFQREEAERKRREEDEKSWRLAREHQNYRLRVKYFYRWRNNARSSATKRILREGKEKMRLYREQQQAIQRRQQAEKEKAEKEARRAAERQAVEDSRRISLLATSVRRRGSVAYSADHDPEEQLLASGIFSGLRDDPRSLARRVVREAAAADGGDAWSMASASRSFRYPESELELEPAPSARDSPDTSSVGGRREGWKTRSLREKFGIEPRRSLSASGSVVNGASFLSSSSRFRQSLPGSSSNKTTNFSRKRSAEEDGDDQDGEARRRSLYSSNAAPKTNGFARSRHWDLRARGFVPTPDGNWLPEAIVKAGKQRDSALEPESPRSEPRGYDHDPELLPDRDPSPTPSDLRLRLARLKQSRPHGLGHGTRHSVDLPPAASGFATDRWLLSPASPPHPPFASRHPANAANGAATAHAASRSPAADISPPPPPPPAASHPTPGIRPVSLHGKRKRTTEDADFATADRGIDGVAGDHQQSPSPSPSSSAARKKKANLDLDLNFNLDLHRLRRRDGGDADVDLHPPAAVPGREETCAMVENTRRMLRELREFMDRADREEGRAAAPGAGVPAAAPAAAGAAVGGESEVGVYSGR
ncbi:uncharacterized protein THITE_2106885 [Thermothielavioides terrestris NRRL 8126]|uniref:SAC3/GANP/THP3 conserved domain-containing protein n=1 Tax=Thermothielavioides terrestris (strain ATCC 38088 / NRRL 8126) TaxID=578455 RepID=G2QRY2_THETT|nr:uncharacterized protein THITE_2106885 [Thermothielavioides terrestris NRRL 8126]AEO62569.1 hypothetical protein THITE_2106885 [Thermothielavioides terrestris NRRL 8126]